MSVSVQLLIDAPARAVIGASTQSTSMAAMPASSKGKKGPSGSVRYQSPCSAPHAPTFARYVRPAVLDAAGRICGARVVHTERVASSTASTYVNSALSPTEIHSSSCHST